MQMAFNSLDAFFKMGSHGVYVWSAWVLVFLVCVLLIWLSVLQRRDLHKKAQRHKTQLSNHSRKTSPNLENPSET